MKMTKVYGYLVSGTKVKGGRFAKTLKEAKAEMTRQMRAGASSSGIMEITSKETYKRMVKK